MTGTVGTDDELLALLRAAPAEAWASLFDAADRLAGAASWVTWHEPRQRDDGSWTMPWPEYTHDLDAVRSGLAAVGAVTPLVDWMNWEGRSRYSDGAAVAAAPPADCVRLATALVRGERFGDGVLDAAMGNGTLLALVARLRRWHDEGR